MGREKWECSVRNPEKSDLRGKPQEDGRGAACPMGQSEVAKEGGLDSCGRLNLEEVDEPSGIASSARPKTFAASPWQFTCRGFKLEARVRIELTHKGFADLSLTTWVPRPCSIR